MVFRFDKVTRGELWNRSEIGPIGPEIVEIARLHGEHCGNPTLNKTVYLIYDLIKNKNSASQLTRTYTVLHGRWVTWFSGLTRLHGKIAEVDLKSTNWSEIVEIARLHGEHCGNPTLNKTVYLIYDLIKNKNSASQLTRTYTVLHGRWVTWFSGLTRLHGKIAEVDLKSTNWSEIVEITRLHGENCWNRSEIAEITHPNLHALTR